MPARVVDIAGVPVAFEAPDAERAAILATLAAGFEETTRPAVASLTVDTAVGTVPSGLPRSELFGIKFWDADDGMVVTARSLVIEVKGTRARAHLPDLEDSILLEGCGYLPLTWLLARHRRFVMHSAAVRRDDDALLLLGNSGAGKSTLAAAALDAGWQALSDDLTIVEHAVDSGEGAGETGTGSGGALRLYGIHKAPAVPAEIGGAHVATATVLGDLRDRVGLSRDVLTPGGHAIAGVVLITHSDAPEGSLRALRSYEVLPLLLQSFAGTIDPDRRVAFFPTAVALSRLPGWELGHASDPATRRSRAEHHLDAIFSGSGATTGDRGD